MVIRQRAKISVLLMALTFSAASLLWADSPGQIVVKTIDQGLTILKDPEYQSFDKMPERREKLWDAVKGVFSFEETAKRALGRHWKDRTPQEREEFTTTFKNILKNIYLEKSDTYEQENIIYISDTIEGNRSKVHTFFTTRGGKQFEVDFSMLFTGGEWKIYDVIVEGVSIVGNYRSQFNSILSKSTFAELMDILKEKEVQVSKI